jgi:hypothetical protein
VVRGGDAMLGSEPVCVLIDRAMTLDKAVEVLYYHVAPRGSFYFESRGRPRIHQASERIQSPLHTVRSECSSPWSSRRCASSAAACGSSSVGRALAFQAGCREFESRLPLQRGLVGLLASSAQVIVHSSIAAGVAQSVEHVLGKDEVAGSIPVPSSTKTPLARVALS